MKKKALVTGGTAKDVAAIAALVINIKEVSPNLVDEIVIFHDGIKNRDKKRFNKIFPTRFIDYEFPVLDKAFTPEILSWFSPMVFCKYECFRLLEEYSTVIWSDYDVYIQKSFEALVKNSTASFQILFTPQTKVSANFKENLILKHDMAQYNLDTESICGSLFILRDTLKNHKDIHSYCIEKTYKYGDCLAYGEQPVLCLAIQDFSLAPEKIPNDCQGFPYSVHPVQKKEYVPDAYILHAYGGNKFWNGLYNEGWQKNYEKWLKMGGSTTYKKDGFLKQFLFRIKRKILHIKKNKKGI